MGACRALALHTTADMDLILGTPYGPLSMNKGDPWVQNTARYDPQNNRIYGIYTELHAIQLQNPPKQTWNSTCCHNIEWKDIMLIKMSQRKN